MDNILSILKNILGLKSDYHYDFTQPAQAAATPNPYAQMKMTTKVLPGATATPDYSNAVQVAQQMTAQPQVPSDPNFRYAFEQYPQDLKAAALKGRGQFQPQQPPQNISNLIRQYFPNEATQAAMVASNENAGYNPTVKDNVNQNGSPDRGIFQINKDTFNGLMSRQGDLLKKLGINSFEDLYDPAKNIQVARLIQQGSKQANPQTGGYGGWFGWQDNGYNLNNGYFSQPTRIAYELGKKK